MEEDVGGGRGGGVEGGVRPRAGVEKLCQKAGRQGDNFREESRDEVLCREKPVF